MERSSKVLSLVLLLTLSSAQAFRIPFWSTPSTDNEWTQSGLQSPRFCNGLSCPKFKISEITSEYVVRQYANMTFAGIVVEDRLPEPAETKGFKALFGYISGKNDEGIKIPMTVPVLTSYLPKEDGPPPKPESPKNFTVSFYLQPKIAADPPKPLNPKIKFINAPDSKVYVTTFGGYAPTPKVLHIAKHFIEALKEDDVEVSPDSGMLFLAVYDAPFKFFGRHNELWYIPKDQDADVSGLMSMPRA
ncbi:hypothetical protein WJX84_001239 [Apatococcus fuscideae]